MRSLRWLSEPAVVFFAVGAALFVAYTLLSSESVEPITLGEAGRDVLFGEFEGLTGRPASADEQEQLIEGFYRRELLFREALRTGLQRSDSGVRAALIESMQQSVSGELTEPDSATLVGYYSENLDRYYSEASMSVDQVFFRERPTDSAALLATLRGRTGEVLSVGAPPVDFQQLGDSPWQGRRFPDYGLSMLRGLFGAELLSTLQELALERWEGPFESGDGWHFFRVRQREAQKPLAFEAVQDQVRADYQAEVLSLRINGYVDRQRKRYPLERLP